MASRHGCVMYQESFTGSYSRIGCYLGSWQTAHRALQTPTAPNCPASIALPDTSMSYQGSDCCFSDEPSCSDFAVMPCSSCHLAMSWIAPSICLRIDASLSDISACAVWGGRAELDGVFDGAISAAEGSVELEVGVSIVGWAGFVGGTVGSWVVGVGCGRRQSKTSLVVPANRQQCSAFTGRSASHVTA
jgi:hypothetical protein